MLGRYFFMWAYLVGAKTIEGIDGQCSNKKLIVLLLVNQPPFMSLLWP
jgi:hypothetical protein